MTRALITGIAGFVGSHLAEYLLAHTDWHITGFMRWNDPLDNLEGLAPQINEGKVKLVYGDLTDAWSVDSAVQKCRPHYVFHLAAQSYVMASIGAPVEALRVNGEGTYNLLEALGVHAPNAWIHNCSSSEVYGKASGVMDESRPLHPSSPYSVSKIAQDSIGRYYAEAYGLRVLTTRMFTHTGPRRGDVFMESSFAKQIVMIDTGLIDPPVKVGNLAAVRTIADVRDAVRAYHMLLTVNPQPGEVYNIGGAHTCTAGDVLDALFEAAGVHYEAAVDEDRMRPVDADHQIPDCSKFMRHTGWEPKITFEKTMRDLWAYWRNRVKNSAVVLQR